MKLLPPLSLPKRHRKRAVGQGTILMVLAFVFIFAALAALVLGVVGVVEMHSRPGPVPSWNQAGMAVIQLYSGQAPSWLEEVGEPPGSYSIARLIAPASTIYAFLTTALVMLAERWLLVRARLAHNHAIIAGGGRHGVLLARSVAQGGRTAVLVDAGTASGAMSGSPSKGVIPLSGVPEDPVALRRAGSSRAAEVFAMASEGHANAAIALTVRAARQGRKRAVNCYVHLGDSELHAALEARLLTLPPTADFKLHLIDRNFVLAEELVRRSFAPDPTSVVLTGEPGLSRAVLRRVLTRWERDRGRCGRRMACVAGIEDGDGQWVLDLERAQRRAAPGSVDLVSSSEAVDIAVQRLTSSGPRGGEPRRGSGQERVLVYVCPEADADAMKLALRTLRCAPERDIEVVVCLREGTGFSEAFAGGPVRLFDDVAGTLRVVAAADILADADAVRGSSTVERLAVALHESYLAELQKSGHDGSELPHAVAWRQLAPEQRESNRAQAWSLGEKLRMIGCAVLPLGSDLTSHVLSNAEVETLARAEHERWCAERRALGIVYAPMRTPRGHPDLLDWSGLSVETREKDLAFIRSLPGILASLGYAVVRLPTQARESLAALEPEGRR